MRRNSPLEMLWLVPIFGFAACATGSANVPPSPEADPAPERAAAATEEAPGEAGPAQTRPADEDRDFWQLADGPYGGWVEELLCGEGGNLYAGTSQGLFRRESGGERWERVDGWVTTDTHTEELGKVPVIGTARPLASLPGGLFVASHGVVRSRDGGASWTRLGEKQTGLSALNVVAETAGEILYVAAQDGQGGLLRSSDAGESWESVLGGAEGMERLRFDALVATDDGTLFASATTHADTQKGQLYRSRDGATWKKLPEPPIVIKDFAEAEEETLLAIGWRYLQGSEIRIELHRSTDGGASWSKRPFPQDARLRNLSRTADGEVYLHGAGGLFRRNGPDEWTPVVTDARVFSVARCGGALHAGTPSGVLRRAGGGDAWSPLSRGLRASEVRAFAGGGDGPVFALLTESLYRSTDGGASWEPVADHPDDIRHMAAGSDGTLFVSTSEGELQRRAPGGDWSAVGSIRGGTQGLVVTSGGAPLLYGKRSIYRLEEGALSRQIPPVEGDLIGALWTGPEDVVFASMVEAGLYRSADGGRSFEPVPDSAEDRFMELAFGSGGTAYGWHSARGLVQLGDPDAGWTEVENGQLTYRPSDSSRSRAVRSLALSPGGDLFAATRRGGVYRYAFEARAWEPVLSGLKTGSVGALHVTPEGHLLAATPRGVYRSTAPH